MTVARAEDVFGDSDLENAALRSDGPTLGKDAYHGITGEIVHAIEPHTESSNAPVLVQLLAMVGSAMGRNPHVRVEANRHGTNLDTVIVGETSRSRKGTSHAQARRPVTLAAPTWAEHCIQSGLSSGEGLIHAVRNPTTKIVDGAEATVDQGVADKRLLVVESEFASTLRVMGRDGNTLSAIVRQAWDGETLKVLTKNTPTSATEPHISIIGHITRDELARELSSTDQSNGFANRFLFIHATRSKLLPEGGQAHLIDWAPIVKRLDATFDYAHKLRKPVERDTEAREYWARIYEDLSTGHPGMLGAVTSRAEAQVTRLALIYAVLDCQPKITTQHLQAALAVWQYSEASCKHIFGDKLGDPDADRILDALHTAGETGLTRTQISQLFKNHKKTTDIGRALAVLHEQGHAHQDPESSGGRPIERWKATQ